MIFIYLQTIPTGKKGVIPYRLTLKNDDSLETATFTFRPESVIPKKTYEQHHLDRLELLAAPPFCDSADELIEIFQNNPLVFSDAKQFQLLKSQFRTIGYNFNLNPKYLFYGVAKDKPNAIDAYIQRHGNDVMHGLVYAEAYVELMRIYHNESFELQQVAAPTSSLSANFELSTYKMAPGVYYFLNESKEVIYVGKAKNIRKRLQSHFSKQTKASTIDYPKVKSINVEYSGNDILAQLIESANIKVLKPIYNTQQVADPAPYIINKSKTAKGISKLQITRKDIKDNMPERYFNRLSVKQSLDNFCSDYDLCRKHCGLENVKGPCSNYTVKNNPCVCAGDESIAHYNKRFELAFYNFGNRKARKIYKLKGRNKTEDAFIYLVNGIYEGYGFIDKDVTISNVNDILGHLIVQSTNYDTSRIVSGLDKSISPEHVLDLSGV
ncbi:nucleotide excision repair endonuclease [Gelidibacter algens]|nr:nucleotide excision repair endonuclease [Gelidibacter algens]